jgi:hypothetical protein
VQNKVRTFMLLGVITSMYDILTPMYDILTPMYDILQTDFTVSYWNWLRNFTARLVPSAEVVLKSLLMLKKPC